MTLPQGHGWATHMSMSPALAVPGTDSIDRHHGFRDAKLRGCIHSVLSHWMPAKGDTECLHIQYILRECSTMLAYKSHSMGSIQVNVIANGTDGAHKRPKSTSSKVTRFHVDLDISRLALGSVICRDQGPFDSETSPETGRPGSGTIAAPTARAGTKGHHAKASLTIVAHAGEETAKGPVPQCQGGFSYIYQHCKAEGCQPIEFSPYLLLRTMTHFDAERAMPLVGRLSPFHVACAYIWYNPTADDLPMDNVGAQRYIKGLPSVHVPYLPDAVSASCVRVSALGENIKTSFLLRLSHSDLLSHPYAHLKLEAVARLLKERGHNVHVAGKQDGDLNHVVDFAIVPLDCEPFPSGDNSEAFARPLLESARPGHPQL